MNMKSILVKRKYYILSSILTFLAGIVVGYFLGFPSFVPTWLGVAIPITWVIEMFWNFLKEARQLEKEPSFELENPRVERHNEGTKDEYKDLCFDVRNKGRGGASL